MMATAVFSNVTTTRGREILLCYLNRYGVGAVIPDHFRGNFRSTSRRRREGIHIAFGFTTWYERPTTLDGGVEYIEIGVGHS